jgi:hypothetical protein
VNLYFGGLSGSAATVFGVQIGADLPTTTPKKEATLVKSIGAASAVNTTPSYSISSGVTYLFLGSTVISGNSHIYRMSVANGTVDADYNGATTNINGAVVYMSSRAYAVSDGGTVYAISAFGSGSGGFTNVTGFPKTTAAAKAIEFGPWVDYKDLTAYFGDDGGNVHAYKSDGSIYSASYPVAISSSIKITSTPIYRSGGGVIGVGANDGYAYFIDRSAASVFKRFFVSASGTVSSVSYNANISAYMASSSDGKLVFINGADVTDPTSSTP